MRDKDTIASSMDPTHKRKCVTVSFISPNMRKKRREEKKRIQIRLKLWTNYIFAVYPLLVNPLHEQLSLISSEF